MRVGLRRFDCELPAQLLSTRLPQPLACSLAVGRELLALTVCLDLIEQRLALFEPELLHRLRLLEGCLRHRRVTRRLARPRLRQHGAPLELADLDGRSRLTRRRLVRALNTCALRLSQARFEGDATLLRGTRLGSRAPQRRLCLMNRVALLPRRAYLMRGAIGHNQRGHHRQPVRPSEAIGEAIRGNR